MNKVFPQIPIILSVKVTCSSYKGNFYDKHRKNYKEYSKFPESYELLALECLNVYQSNIN